MTLLISFHSSWGATGGPKFYRTDAAGGTIEMLPAQFIAELGSSDVLFAVHGFNTPFKKGATGAIALEQMLALPPTIKFVAVLWPGDFWLPGVNYPFEGNTANDCGKRLAKLCNDELKAISSISFLSHSLGARLTLAAAGLIGRKLKRVCLTAAAVNRDALENEFAAARANSETIANLASDGDLTLLLAFPTGDFLGDLFTDGPDSHDAALGLEGLRAPLDPVHPAAVIRTDKVKQPYGHGDYFPPFPVPLTPGKYGDTIGFMRRALLGEQQIWPPA